MICPIWRERPGDPNFPFLPGSHFHQGWPWVGEREHLGLHERSLCWGKRHSQQTAHLRVQFGSQPFFITFGKVMKIYFPKHIGITCIALEMYRYTVQFRSYGVRVSGRDGWAFAVDFSSIKPYEGSILLQSMSENKSGPTGEGFLLLLKIQHFPRICSECLLTCQALSNGICAAGKWNC